MPKEDMLISESKRDETGKGAGCKFLWVITPATSPGNLKFELESFSGGNEFFEVPSAGGVRMGGIASENGTGMATGPVKGSLRLPGVEVDPNKGALKSSDPGTGF